MDINRMKESAEAEQSLDELLDELPDELVGKLAARLRAGEKLSGPGSAIGGMVGRVIERALEEELTDHLGYVEGDPLGAGSGNNRNGAPAKTLKTEHGEIPIRAPRDRKGTFEPQLVAKRQTRIDGLDEKIISLYSRGLSVRDIERQMLDLYGYTIGPDQVSRITDGVLDEIRAWQTRPLESVYPIVFLDALVVKIRDASSRMVSNRSAYIAVGVNADGEREVLGIWLAKTEGAKFWLGIVTELKQRGVDDILICCCDGLKGLPEAVEAVYGKAIVQTCIVHLIRHSLRFVAYKNKKKVAAALKPIYTAIDADHALEMLDAFDAEWGEQYPMITASWRDNWERVTPFLAFPPDVRKVIYTTNSIENLNRQIRRVIKTRGHFPTEDAAIKLIWLAIEDAQKSWRRVYNWNGGARTAFAIHFGDRMP